jgi:hypothetical protein
MKTKYFKIAWLIFTLIYTVNGHSQISDSTGSDIIVYQEPDTSYTGLANGIPSRDQVPETVWLSTGLPVSGGIPYDILYVADETFPPLDSRIFIYTERKLLSYDMFEYWWGPTIDLSEYGSQTLSKFTNTLLPRSREKHLAYNPDKHELYCLTQDLKILVIDPFSLLTMPIIREIIPDTDIGLLDWAIIKYDPVSTFLFLGLCQNDLSPEAELIAFNTTDYSNEYSINELENLNDFSFNPEYPLLYLSSSTEIQVRNTSDGSIINTYTMPGLMGVILNAYNENRGLNKTYCLPKSETILQYYALIFDGNNTTPRTISLEKGNFGCGIYNAPSNKVYIDYTNTNSLPSGFISFNPDTEHMTDHPLENQDIIMDMANIEDRVFISTKDNIYCCRDGAYYPDYTLISPGSYFYRIAATNYYNVPRIWATNMMDQSLQIAYAPSELSNLEWYEPQLVSGAALQGFFNHADQKLYLYYGFRDENQDHKFMYIYDPATGDIRSVNIVHDPTGVVMDEETNTIYFSTYLDNIIRRYNASGNSWLEPITLPEGFSSCYEMYLSNRKLYCTVKHLSQGEGGTPYILVYDLEEPLANPVIIQIQGFSANINQIVSHYTVDEADRVYVSVRFAWSNRGRVIRINNDFGITDCGINILHPDEILYDQLHDKILLKYLESDEIRILDFEASPPSSQYFQPRAGLNIIDMEIDPISNLIYFDYNDPYQNGYIDIYSTNGTFVKTVQVGYRALALKYNPLNGLMYVHVPVNFGENLNRKEQIWTIDPAEFDVYSMDLGQNEGHWRNEYYLADLILDDENNKIYTVSAHGNIKVIACSNDQITLYPKTWNWLSFPRLEREANDPVPSQPLLMNISPFPETYIHMKHLTPIDQNIIEKNYDNPDWSGDLEEVRSTLGYKIETSNDDLSILPLTGTVLDPGTIIELYGRKFNWTGYFLPQTQSPFDAIGSEFLDKIDQITGQYWSCFKKDPSPTKSTGGGLWYCACQQGRVEIKYNDMVVLSPSEDISNFHWQMAGQAPLEDPKAPSQSFQYREKPEYDPIFIELDTVNPPEEIGAFAGDSCIGATMILPSDTMALICAYSEGFEGEEITFEMIYSTKSGRPKNRDYYVLNLNTGIRERRRIIAGEKQPYFFVSLKQSEESIPDEISFNLEVIPNPAGDEFIVEYFTNQETAIEMQLFNALGLPVHSWNRGIQPEGSYSYKINTSGFPSGCYYLRMKAGNDIQIRKILIIH